MFNRDISDRWLIDLAALIDAGLPLGTALTNVSKGVKSKTSIRLQRVASSVKKGGEFASAGRTLGLLSELDAKVIETGEKAGNLPKVLRRLAKREAFKAKLKRQFRSRMLMPIVVVVIAIFVTPLPKLVAGTISVNGYLSSTVGSILFVAASLWLVTRAIAWGKRKDRLCKTIDKFELFVPVLGGIRIRQSTTDFLDALSLTYAAGLPIYQAFTLSYLSIQNSQVQSEFKIVEKPFNSGLTLSDALTQIQYLDKSIVGAIRAGEISGQLEETLERMLTSERQRLEADQHFIGEWVPRLFYFTVAMWITTKLLAGS